MPTKYDTLLLIHVLKKNLSKIKRKSKIMKLDKKKKKPLRMLKARVID